MLSADEPTSRCGVAALRGLGAVHVDVEHGVVVGLLEAEIDQARESGAAAASIVSATLRLPASSVPSICTSMGAGRPKFRIWVTMSEGRK